MDEPWPEKEVNPTLDMLIGLTKITGDQKKRWLTNSVRQLKRQPWCFSFHVWESVLVHICVKSTWMNHWDIGLIMKNIKFNSCNKVHQSKKWDQVRSYLAGIFEHGLTVWVKLFTVWSRIESHILFPNNLKIVLIEKKLNPQRDGCKQDLLSTNQCA